MELFKTPTTLHEAGRAVSMATSVRNDNHPARLRLGGASRCALGVPTRALTMRLVAQVGRPSRSCPFGRSGQDEAARGWSVASRAGQAGIKASATYTGQMIVRMKPYR